MTSYNSTKISRGGFSGLYQKEDGIYVKQDGIEVRLSQLDLTDIPMGSKEQAVPPHMRQNAQERSERIKASWVAGSAAFEELKNEAQRKKDAAKHPLQARPNIRAQARGPAGYATPTPSDVQLQGARRNDQLARVNTSGQNGIAKARGAVTTAHTAINQRLNLVPTQRQPRPNSDRQSNARPGAPRNTAQPKDARPNVTPSNKTQARVQAPPQVGEARKTGPAPAQQSRTDPWKLFAVDQAKKFAQSQTEEAQAAERKRRDEAYEKASKEPSKLRLKETFKQRTDGQVVSRQRRNHAWGSDGKIQTVEKGEKKEEKDGQKKLD